MAEEKDDNHAGLVPGMLGEIVTKLGRAGINMEITVSVVDKKPTGNWVIEIMPPLSQEQLKVAILTLGGQLARNGKIQIYGTEI